MEGFPEVSDVPHDGKETTPAAPLPETPKTILTPTGMASMQGKETNPSVPVNTEAPLPPVKLTPQGKSSMQG